MATPTTAEPVSLCSPDTQSIAGCGGHLFTDDSNDFESEVPTAVVAYRTLAAEADAWQAEFEQRATERDSDVGALMSSLARGTREWVRK